MTTINAKEDYLEKYNRALNLILNDVPDNIDDTINAKLLDSIRDSFVKELDKDLFHLIKIFIDNKILVDDFNESDLADKDPEIVNFFINLIATFMKSIGSFHDSSLYDSYLSKLLKYVLSYLNEHFNDQFQNESAICCSLLDLLNDLLVGVDFNDSTREDQVKSFYILFDKHLFSNDSIVHYLDNFCKSIYVRKSYKRLLKQYLIKLILNSAFKFYSDSMSDDNSKKQTTKPSVNDYNLRLKQICLHLSNLTYENRLNNLDLHNDILTDFFFISNYKSFDDKYLLFIIYELKCFHFDIGFSDEKLNYLFNNQLYLSEKSIDTFTNLFAFDILFDFLKDLSKNSDENLIYSTSKSNDGIKYLFYETFAKKINLVCNYFSCSHLHSINDFKTANPYELVDANEQLVIERKVSIKYDKSTKRLNKSSNLLMKFLLNSYSFFDLFVNQDNSERVIFSKYLSIINNTDDEIKLQIQKLKFVIIKLMLIPLNLKLNNSDQEESQILDDSDDLLKEYYRIDKSMLDMNESLNEDENYLLLIKDQSFENKQIFIKNCLLNFKQFLRKFNHESFNLFDHVEMNQLIYLMKNLNIEFEIKNSLVDLLQSTYSSNQLDSDTYRQFIDFLFERFEIVLNESFNENIFKLISIGLVAKTSILVNQTKLIDLIIKHLNHLHFDLAAASKDQILRRSKTKFYISQINTILKFLTHMLKSMDQHQSGSLGFIVDLFKSGDCFVSKQLFSLLINDQNNSLLSIGKNNGEEVEVLNEFKDYMLVFLQMFFTVSSKRFDHSDLPNCLFDSQDEHLNEKAITKEVIKMSIGESEAFLRREQVLFLKSFSVYSLKKYLNTPKNQLTASDLSEINLDFCQKCFYFLHMLDNDFDWQIQLYCLEYFNDILNQLKSIDLNDNIAMIDYEKLKMPLDETDFDENGNLVMSKLNLFEILFCLTDFLKSLFKCLYDCDQHVVNLTSKILIDLKQNNQLNQILDCLNQKYHGLFQRIIKIKNLIDYKSNEENGSVCIKSANIDDENYIVKLTRTFKLENLIEKLNESKETSDLYTLNPSSILDDIISAYQFDLNEDKAVDCY